MAGHQAAASQESHCQIFTMRGTYLHIIGSQMLEFGHRQKTKVRCWHLTSDREILLQPAAATPHPMLTLNTSVTATLVNAFITSHVDYCNNVFNGTGSVHPHLIQSLINASARCRSGSTTMSWQQFQMNCTGYRCNNDLSISYTTSSTNQFIRVHHRIYHPCVFALARSTVDVIFIWQPVATWLFHTQPIKRMDRAVSLCPDHLYGTHSHWRL